MMMGSLTFLFRSLGLFLRACVASVVAGLLLGWTGAEVDSRLAPLPLAEQAAIVAAMLAVLGLLTLLFAAAGPVGVLSFWLATLAVAR